MHNFDLARQGQRAKGAQEGIRVLVKRAWRRCGNASKCNIRPCKRWQRAKATWRVLGPWWNVLRAGFETLRVSGPGGTCFAQVLKPSKCRISTWQGRGKGRKVHRRVSCPSETCLAQAWKPSKCNIRPGKALAEGFGALVERASRRFWNPLNAVFRPGKARARAVAKRWQGAKAARKGLGPWWNVLRAGFETF